jgi:hypothetical protein
MFELTVIVKGEDQALRRKFLMYEENVQLNQKDPILLSHVTETVKDFKGEVEDVLVNIKMVW